MQTQQTQTFQLNGIEFKFELCRKADQPLGPITVDQWWMPITPLYGQRKKNLSPEHNHLEILRLYWAAVEHDGATEVRVAQERFLLASLVSHVRVEGSRTIFADSFLAPSRSKQRIKEVGALEAALSVSRTGKLTREEFHERSWQAIGRPNFPDGIQSVYNRMAMELFDDPCALLSSGQIPEALNLVKGTWGRFMRTIGRRRRHLDEKIVLDSLSYEARAAFHTCYSVAWSVLIPLLAGEDGKSAIFLRFWQTDWTDSRFGTSLFHGHVFGLHPASGLFMLTATGPQLIGEWLADPLSADALGRLLNGYWIALHNYRQRRELEAENRPSSKVKGVADIAMIEELQQERRRGRRRK